MATQQIYDIPIFPLKSVLFPRGKLSLQIFEQRYLNMISRCMRVDAGFGVCLLKEGEEVVKPGRKQTVHGIGTYAKVVDWDQLSNGLLGITIEGEKKFTIKDCHLQDDQLLMAEVEFCQSDHIAECSLELDQSHDALVDLLRNLAMHPLVEELNLQIDYSNLRELGWRLSELIPMETIMKQDLLELNDAYDRIEKIEKIISDLAREG